MILVLNSPTRPVAWLLDDWRQAVVVAGGVGCALIVGVAASPSAPPALLSAVFGLLAALGFTFLLLRNMQAGLCLLLATRASLDLVATKRVGPLNSAAILALAIVVAGILYLVMIRQIPRVDSPIFPFLAFLGVCAVGLLETPDFSGGAGDWLRFASLPVVYLLVAHFASDDRAFRNLALAIALSAVLPLLMGLWQFVTAQGFLIKHGEFLRVKGTFLHPNPFSIYLVFVCPVIIAVGVSLRRWRAFAMALTGVTGFCLIVTFTRTAWIGLGVALLVMGWLRYKSILFLLPVALAGVLFLFPSVSERFSDLSSQESPVGTATNSFDWRLEHWQEVLPALKESPIWGRGLDFYQGATADGKQAHNDFVRLLVETGVLGVALFAWWLGRFTLRALQEAKRDNIFLRETRALTRESVNSQGKKPPVLQGRGVDSGLAGALDLSQNGAAFAPTDKVTPMDTPSFREGSGDIAKLRRAMRVGFAATCAAYVIMSLTSNMISQPALQWYFWTFAALALTRPKQDPSPVGVSHSNETVLVDLTERRPFPSLRGACSEATKQPSP